MELVNTKPLPKGSRFYPITDKEQLLHLPLMLSNKYYKASLEVAAMQLAAKSAGYDTDKYSTLNNAYNVERYSANFLPQDFDSEYPIFLVSNLFLTMLSPEGEIQTKHRKSFLSGSRRFIGIEGDIPVSGMQAKLQWDPKRLGLIVHDHTYEGPLVSTGSGTVSKALNSTILGSINEGKLAKLLGIDIDYTKLGYNAGINLDDLIIKYLLNETNSEELFRMLSHLGFLSRTYDRVTSKIIISINEDKPKKLDITTTLRTKLIYMYGGYKLPDNHTEWFDG